MKNSSGEYIAFLDDDDEWLPEKLHMQVSILESSPLQVGCVYTGLFSIDKSNGRILDIMLPDKRENLFWELLKRNCIVTSSVLLRRKCFEEIGLFDENWPYNNDYDMWIRIAKKYHFECIKKPLTKYYQHNDKMSARLELVISGIEKLLEKYGQLFALNRKDYSRRFRDLGVYYSLNGQRKRGIGACLTAISIYPYEIRNYVVLGTSLLGRRKINRENSRD